MKIASTHIALIATLLYSTAAIASDKVSLNLSPNEVNALGAALIKLDGYTKVARGSRAEDEAVVVPYDLKDVRITIAYDQNQCSQFLKIFREAARGLKNQDVDALADKAQPIDLHTVDVADLNLGANPITPSILAALAPICPSCIGESQGKKP